MSTMQVTFTVPTCKREHQLGNYNQCYNCDFVKCETRECDEDVHELRGDQEGPLCLACQAQHAAEALADAQAVVRTKAAFSAKYYLDRAEDARNAKHPDYVIEGWENLAAKYAEVAA